jgi:hypothetical protein
VLIRVTVLVSILAGASLLLSACLFFRLRSLERNNRLRSKNTKLSDILACAQDCDLACTKLLSSANAVRAELNRIWRNGRVSHSGRPDEARVYRPAGDSPYLEVIDRIYSDAADMRSGYFRSYVPVYEKLMARSDEMDVSRDAALAELLLQAAHMFGQVEETWGKLEALAETERVKVLLAHFCRLSNELYLQHEANLRLINDLTRRVVRP